jgi:hypothetical protein
MVFYTLTMAMRARNAKTTQQTLLEFSYAIYNGGGMIRSLTNEGIIRPYKKFRDTNGDVLTYARYVQVQFDYGDDEQVRALQKVVQEHPDVFTLSLTPTETADASMQMYKDPNQSIGDSKFVLDAFTKTEQEILWPPQTSADVYESLDKNWKEFSRTRWSDYLRN